MVVTKNNAQAYIDTFSTLSRPKSQVSTAATRILNVKSTKNSTLTANALQQIPQLNPI